LLAGSPFPPPALLGTFDGGWDSTIPAEIGAHPSFDGKIFGPGVHPRYTLDGIGFTGAVPLGSISWGESALSSTSLALGDVSVTALAGRYSTGLLQAVASKQNLPSLNLHVYDNQGRETRRWTLTGVFATSFAVSDGTGDQSPPVNSFSLNFKAISAIAFSYDSSGNALPPRSVSYDVDTKEATSVDFGGATFAMGAQPQQLLDLGTGQVAAHNVSWGFAAPGGGRPSPPPVPQDFTFSSDSGPATLGLLSAVFTHSVTPLVTLTTRDDAGRVVAQWNLANVRVTSYQSSDSDGTTPIDSFSLHADRVQLVRKTYNSSGALTGTFGGGWDFVNDVAYNTLPTTLAGNTYPPSAQPTIALQIDDSTKLIPIDSFAFGDHQPSTPTGQAQVEPLSIAVPQGAYSTGLLQETADPVSHKVAVITRNASGQEIMRWVVTDAQFATYGSSDSADDGQGALDVFTLSFLTIHAQYTPYDKGAPLTPVVADWDIDRNAITSTPLSGNTYAPGAEPRLALEIGGTLIPVDSASEAFQRAVGPLAGQAPLQPPPPDLVPFSLSMPQGRWSPSLFAAVATGADYPTASLISRDSSGRITGRWNMTHVQFGSYLTSGSSSGGTSESVSVEFGSIERTVEVFNPSDGTTKVYAGGWNFITRDATPDGASLGPTLTGNTYAAGAVPEYTMAISGETGLIPVSFFAWGDAQGSTIDGPSFNQVQLLIPAGRYDTGIIYNAAKARSFDSIVIVRRDAQGRPIYRYTFNLARFSSLGSQDSPGQFVLNSVSLDYKGLKVERIDYSSAGDPLPPVKFDWDIVEKQGTGAGLGGQTFAPGTEPESVLDLGTAQLAVTGYSWGESHDPNTDQPDLQDFSFTTLTGPASLGLISAVPLATAYPQIVLTTRDADGHIVTQWQLTGVHLVSWQTQAATGAGTPFESVAMSFSSIKLVYNAYAPAAVVEAVSPAPRNTAVPSLVIRFSEPVTGVDLADLQLTRNGGPNLLTSQQTLNSSDSGRTWTLGNLSAITSAADGTYSLTLSTALAAGIFGQLTTEPIAQATGTQWTLDRVAPTLSARSFNYIASPHRIEITFSEDVGASLAKSDLTIKSLGAGAPSIPAITGFAYDPTSHIAVWTFASNLLDGDYRATLTAGSVADAAGNPLALSTLDFFAFAGDANHDRTVDFNDLVALAQNYNTAGKTFAQGNFNYDPAGNVDFNDLVILAQRYNTSLPAAGAPVPIASSTVSFSEDWAAALAAPGAPISPIKTKPKPVFSPQPPIKLPKKQPLIRASTHSRR
jgi:type VI protein secretion system component Hcp